MRVVVVGSVNLDTVLRVAELPRPGQTVPASAVEVRGGGKGANAALASAAAGSPTTLVGCVGADPGAAQALAVVRAAGVDVGGVTELTGVPTGTAMVLVDARGENSIVIAAGANAHVDPDQVRAAIAGHDDVAVVLTNLELPDPVVHAAADAATAAGAVLLVNPAPARDLPPGLLARHPILTPNQGEATALTGHQDPETAARDLMELTAAPVVVTLGERGALLVATDGTATHVPAPKAGTVDTTGAGDTLNGALAAGLARGTALDEALREAVRRATAATEWRGAQPSVAELRAAG